MKNCLMKYILDTYGIEADYPFRPSADTAVFRNPRNRKWFAVLLDQLSKRNLGMQEDAKADVLNVKCDPVMNFALIDHQRIFPAYHMNKEHWISVLLDSSITMEEIAFLVDVSYQLVDHSGKVGRLTKV